MLCYEDDLVILGEISGTKASIVTRTLYLFWFQLANNPVGNQSSIAQTQKVKLTCPFQNFQPYFLKEALFNIYAQTT